MLELSTNKLVKFFTLFSSGGFLLLTLVLPLSTMAAFTQQINYQGKLTDSSGDVVADGTYSIEFKLYDDPTAGSVLWTENHTGANEITVTDGLFSVMLGSLTSLSSVDFNQALYLSLNVEADGEMTPRKTLGSVPNSFNALKFDGLSSTSVAVLDRENTFTATTTFGNTFVLSGADSVNFSQLSSVAGFSGVQIFNNGYNGLDLNNSLWVMGNVDDPNDLGYAQIFNPNTNNVDFYVLEGLTPTSTTFNLNGSLWVSGTTSVDSLNISNGITGGSLSIFGAGNINYVNAITLGASATSTLSNVLPVSNLTYELGSDSLRWLNTWTDSLNASGTSTLSTTTIDDLTVANNLDFSGSLEKIADDLVLPRKVRNLYIADNYMYVVTYGEGSFDSFRIVDISDPSNPRIVGGDSIFNLPIGKPAKRVFVVGNYAYILYEVFLGLYNPLRIVDISDKSNPVVVGGADLNLPGLSSSSGQPFYVSGKHAYILDNTSLYIVDVSDPYSPQFLSKLSNTGDGHWDIKVLGDYAYIGSREEISGSISPLTIVNVKDKLNPFIVSKASVPGLNRGAWSLDVVGPYVYLGLGALGQSSTTDMFRIIDVSDPANPVVKGGEDIGTGSITLSEDDYALNYVKVLGDRLYATTWASNFLTIDISSSTNPVIVRKDVIGDSVNNHSPLTFDFKGRYLAVGYAPINTPGASTGHFRMFKMPGMDVAGANIDSLLVGAFQSINNAVFNQRVSIWDSLEVGAGGIYTQGSLSVLATTSASYFGGSLGIGTTTPAYRLTVNSANGTDNLFQVATTTNQNIFTINNDGIARFGNDIIISGTGTSTIAGNLTVTGNIAKDGTTYTNPSYVFDCYLDGVCENYQFTPLPDAIAYMKENKHLLNLPDINGVYFLEDRQRLQTEKLEEIMIYLSELRTEIDKFSDLFAGSSISEDGTLVVKNIQAERFCLGETCLTEIELKALLSNSNILPVIVTPIEADFSDLLEEATTTDPDISDEPEPDPIIEPEIISEPVAPDLIAEPESDLTPEPIPTEIE